MIVATEHRITAADGSSTVVDEYAADAAAGSDHAILFLPALGVPISYYRSFFRSWAERGEHVFGLEVRGRPRSSTADVKKHDFGYATIIEQDLPAAIAQTPLAGIRHLTVVGHSLGGQLALLATGSGALHPERIMTIASGSGHYSSVDRGWLKRLARRWVTPLAVAISAVIGYFPGHKLGFGDRQPRTMIGDWHREAWFGRFDFAGTEVDYEGALTHIEVPVLQLSFDDDLLVSHRAVELLAERVAPTTPERIHLTAADNHGQRWDHVRWVRQNPAAVLDRYEAWTAGRDAVGG